jgi:hypothetical protein
LPQALERMGTLQAQYAPSMYVGLWSRVAGFERDAFTRALERREVVQGTLMRATIHLVSADDYWPLALGVREPRRTAWIRVARRGLTEAEVASAAERVRTALAEGPLRRREIAALLGDKILANGVGMWLDLVRVPPSGTWERRRADLYDLAERWLGPPEASVEDGRERLVRRYLEGYGPAPAADVANWAGLPVAEVARTAQGLDLRTLREQRGAEPLDLPDALLPDPETPAPVRFLPTWDASLLVHARRTGILPEEQRPKIFNTKTPQSVATFWSTGASQARGAGIEAWSASSRSGASTVQPGRRSTRRPRDWHTYTADLTEPALARDYSARGTRPATGRSDGRQGGGVGAGAPHGRTRRSATADGAATRAPSGRDHNGERSSFRSPRAEGWTVPSRSAG